MPLDESVHRKRLILNAAGEQELHARRGIRDQWAVVVLYKSDSETSYSIEIFPTRLAVNRSLKGMPR